MRGQPSLLALLLLVTATASKPGVAATGPIDVVNLWGTRGTYRTDAAQTLPVGTFSLAIVADVAIASSVFLSHDRETFNRNRLALAWVPARGWEVAMGAGLVANLWQTYLDSDTTILGNPSLRAKYVLPWHTDRLHLGATLGLWLPSAIDSASLVVRAANIDIQALATLALAPWAQLSAQVGYGIDGSHRLGGASLQPDIRLAYDVQHGSAVTLGAGVQSAFVPHPSISLGPFVEGYARLDTSTALRHDSVVFSAGLKAWSRPRHVFEGAIGCDVRAWGAPDAAARTPGVMPWTLFAMASVHFAPDAGASSACQTSGDCADGMQCASERCVVVRQEQAPTFVVTGSVVDASTLRGIEDATVTFVGFEKAPITPDRSSGAFESFPLPCGETPMQWRVQAPGYKTYAAELIRGAQGQVFSIVVQLQREAGRDEGVLRGTITDARTGAPVRARVSAPGSGFEFAVQADGTFRHAIAPGRYDLLFSAPGYQTQQKRIRLHGEETVILNIEMAPTPARRRQQRPIE